VRIFAAKERKEHKDNFFASLRSIAADFREANVDTGG
jgi:hypothetical protein